MFQRALALGLLTNLESDQRIAAVRFHAVRAHLLEMAGDRAAARSYLEAGRAAACRTSATCTRRPPPQRQPVITWPEPKSPAVRRSRRQ